MAKEASPLFSIQRRAITVTTKAQIEFHALFPGKTYGAVLTPASSGLSAADWAKSNREGVNDQLDECGALLLRDFKVEGIEEFHSFVEACAGQLLDYRNRSTPRTHLHKGVFTSTEYPMDQHIPQHHEMSYSRSWPTRIFFHCLVAPNAGGQTPIANGADVYDRIPPTIRRRFEKHGVMYIRNYGRNLDLSWQEVFQTEDPVAVDDFCAKQGIAAEWLADGRLRTRQVSQAVIIHPRTGKPVWFNQAHLFHVSNLPLDMREEIEHQFRAEDLPRNATYGDGSPIETEALDAVRAAYAEEEEIFSWRNGDILILDNQLMSHGRRPYEKPRSIVVAMS